MSEARRIVADITASPDDSMHAAIAQLSRTERRILLVCDAGGALLGTITDYDIRRAILAGSGLDAPAREVMAPEPIVLTAELSEAQVESFLRRQRVHAVPIVDGARRVVDIRFLADLVEAEAPQERAALVMAGGFGRRLKPFTDELPKPMLAVGGRPMLFILLDQIIAEGFTRIYVSVFYKSDVIVSAINQVARYRDLVTFVHEREPLGTAGALGLLPQRPQRPLLVVNGDLVTQVPLQEMGRYHEREGNAITIATKIEHYIVPYGVIEAENARVVGIREKPKLEFTVSIGAYMLEPAALKWVAPGARLDMPELIDRMLMAGKRVGCFPVHEYWLDVGTPEQYARANHEMATVERGRARP
jgi:dTDP-glucose pyrophosphorylase/CBS domain-containing protein